MVFFWYAGHGISHVTGSVQKVKCTMNILWSRIKRRRNLSYIYDKDSLLLLLPHVSSFLENIPRGFGA